jgi:hypothetical protein
MVQICFVPFPISFESEFTAGVPVFEEKVLVHASAIQVVVEVSEV